VFKQRLREKTVAINEKVPAVLLFNFVTSATTSPLTIVEFSHSARSSVDEKTYFLIELSRLAQG
jgi:hypothetical protein